MIEFLIIFTLMARANLECDYIWENASPECSDSDPYNGYFWLGSPYWIPGIPTNESWFAPSPDTFKGIAVYYSPGLMEATAEWRGLSLEGYIGG